MNTTSASSAVGSSISIANPDSTFAGGYFLLSTISARTTATVAAPIGWTIAANSVNGNFTTTVFYKYSSNSDPASFTFNLNTPINTNIVANIVAMSSVHPSSPLIASNNNNNAASTNILVTGGLIRPVANTYVFSVFSRAQTTNAITLPAGLTSIGAQVNAGPTSAGVAFVVGGLDSSNSTTNSASYTATSSNSAISSGIQLILRPAPAPICIAANPTSEGALDSNLWNPTRISGTFTPQVFYIGATNRIRMTQNASDQSTMAQLKKWYPGAGNKIVVEFDYYVYGGSGADGLAVVLSDASIAPSPGGFGGSLGYAFRSGVSTGFNGGWIGVGLDEFGNYSGSSEGKLGYPPGWVAPAGANAAFGPASNNVSIRGSVNSGTGSRLLANTGTLASKIWSNTNTSATTQRFRITVDHSNGVNAYVSVERDLTATGNSYTYIVPVFDVNASNSLQAPVPTNWLVSFTSSTGGSNNIHEFANISICSNSVNPPGASINASSFTCVENVVNSPWSAAARSPLYTKLVSTPFTFNAAALKADGSLEDQYVIAGGSSKYLQMDIFDDTTPAASCAAYSSPVSSQIIPFTSGTFATAPGRVNSGSITIAKAYSKMMCRIKECTDATCTVYSAIAPACTTDRFSVRPQAITSVTSPSSGASWSRANADGSGSSSTATPIIKAGSNFSLQADTSTVGYNGTPTVDTTNIEWLNAPLSGISIGAPSYGAGSVSGIFSTSAAAASGNGALGTSFQYSDVGYFRFKVGGIRDATWVATSSDSINNDCVVGSYSNTLSGGKYGCLIANQSATTYFGRFVPDRLAISNVLLLNRVDVCAGGCGAFNYLGEQMASTMDITAQNSTGIKTLNYSGAYVRYTLSTANISSFGLRGITPSVSAGVMFSSINRLTPQALTGNFTGGVATGVRLDFTPAALLASGIRTPDGPFLTSFGVIPVDSDGITLASSAINLDTDATAGSDRFNIGTTTLRYGQMRLANAAGSNTQNAVVGISTNYWNGSMWISNTDDQNTFIPAGSISFGRYTGTLSAMDTNVVLGSSTLTLSNGVGKIVLQKPATGKGTFDIGLNLSNKGGINIGSWAGPSWSSGAGDSSTTSANFDYLNNNSGGTGYLSDPAARVTFGIFRQTDRVLDIREQY